MSLPASGAISFVDLQTEFGGTNPIALNEYYAGGNYVPNGAYGPNGAVPTSGVIDLNKFHSTAGSILSGALWAQFPIPNPTPPTLFYLGNGSKLSGNGNKVSSDGGRTWQVRAMNYPPAAVAAGITSSTLIGFNDGVFWAAGSTPGHTIYLFNSTDAETWTTVATYQATYVAADSAYTSADGITKGTLGGQPIYFVSSRIGETLTAANKLLNAAGNIVAAGTVTSVRTTFFAGASGGVAAGGDGLFITTRDNGGAIPYTSADGVTWTARNVYNPVGSLLTGNNTGLSYANFGNRAVIFNNMFIDARYKSANGAPSVCFLTSTDGITFELSDSLPNSDTTPEITASPLIAACDTYVMCVYKNVLNQWGYAISMDGTIWTEYNSLSLSSLTSIYQILFDGSYFQLLTSSGVYYVPA